MDAQTGWIYRYSTLFEDAEYRLVICEYEAIAEPDLYIEFKDEDGDWCAQVPMPIDAERARAIADELKAWSVRVVHEYYEKKRQEAIEPVPNRFDSVEISGLVEPVGEAESCLK